MEDDERSYLLRQIARLQQAKHRWKTVAIAAWLLIIFGPLVIGVVGVCWYQVSMKAQMQAARAAEMQARKNMTQAQTRLDQVKQSPDQGKPKNP